MQKLKQTFHNKQCGPYKLISKLAEGAFGEVFVAQLQGQKYALKISNQRKFIDREVMVYQQLSKQKEFSGLPKIGENGIINNFKYFGMELLGNDLQKLLKQHKRLSLKSVLMIAEQAISRLKFFHGKGFVHRDVKPQNMCIGSKHQKEAHRIFLIDLGLAKRTGDPEDKGGIFGTPSFMSLRAHQSLPLQPADDLQSLIYSLIELFYGGLPWQSMPSENKTQMDRIKAMKKRCTKWGDEALPVEFTSALKRVRQEKREIDYEWYRGIFRKCMDRIGGEYNYDFQWIKKQALKEEKKIKDQKVRIEEQCKVVDKFLNQYSRATIQPERGKGQLVEKKKVKPLPNPAQFYLKKVADQVLSKPKPMSSNGPRIAINREPRSKN